MDIQKVLVELIGVVLLIAIPYIGVLLGKLISAGMAKIKDERVRGIASQLVTWAEKEFVGDKLGSTRFENAYKKLSEMFPSATPEQIKGAIQQGYNQMVAVQTLIPADSKK